MTARKKSTEYSRRKKADPASVVREGEMGKGTTIKAKAKAKGKLRVTEESIDRILKARRGKRGKK